MTSSIHSTLPRLSIDCVNQKGNDLLPEKIFELPEKVIQFGTGALLRSLPDYFIDKANRRGVFNGRVVVVKSTAHGEVDSFSQQDCLYTICIRGISKGKAVKKNIISSSLSRVIVANEQWREVLECARNPEIKIVVSNTTETGIQFIAENILTKVPSSFPGKLLAFLMERYKAFKGSSGAGLVIIPTELIINNGEKLASILIELSSYNKLDNQFISWLSNHNHFCNSLVDRIVPGRPETAECAKLEKRLGYHDKLLTIAEPYCLWAIQGNKYVKSVLSFAKSDKNVIIKDDIEKYRELKLRMLNGTHTLSCGLAILSGFRTVGDSMNNLSFSLFVNNLMMKEIAQCLPISVSKKEVRQYGESVIYRFRNSAIEHKWQSITLQYTSKMKIRVIPLLLRYVELYNKIPECISWGFASYICFMKAVKIEKNAYFGNLGENYYQITDDRADYFYNLWSSNSSSNIVSIILKDKSIWGTDLSQIPGLEESITGKLQLLSKGKHNEAFKKL